MYINLKWINEAIIEKYPEISDGAIVSTIEYLLQELDYSNSIARVKTLVDKMHNREIANF